MFFWRPHLKLMISKTTILALPRSGTTSIYSIFSNHKAQNEYLEEESIQLLTKYRLNNSFNSKIIVNSIIKRWNESKMQVDAASFNFLCAQLIHEIFPQMMYIYLLRDPITWIESFISMLIYYYDIFSDQPMPEWMTDYGSVYADVFSWDVLIQSCSIERSTLGQLLISQLFDFWCNEHKSLLSFCMNKPVLYLRTENISNSLSVLSRFSGINIQDLSKEAHVNEGKNTKRFLHTEDKLLISTLSKPILNEFTKRCHG